MRHLFVTIGIAVALAIFGGLLVETYAPEGLKLLIALAYGGCLGIAAGVITGRPILRRANEAAARARALADRCEKLRRAGEQLRG